MRHSALQVLPALPLRVQATDKNFVHGQAAPQELTLERRHFTILATFPPPLILALRRPLSTARPSPPALHHSLLTVSHPTTRSRTPPLTLAPNCLLLTTRSSPLAFVLHRSLPTTCTPSLALAPPRSLSPRTSALRRSPLTTSFAARSPPLALALRHSLAANAQFPQPSLVRLSSTSSLFEQESPSHVH